MRRNDRQITEAGEILAIMRRCEVCHVAFHAGNYPYLVPMNFGVRYEGDRFLLFFHGADAGTKMRLLRENPNVAFSMSCAHRFLSGGEEACDASMEYESVCGNGSLRIVPEEEKISSLTDLMRQYEPSAPLRFHPEAVAKIAVLCLEVREISGKRLRAKS